MKFTLTNLSFDFGQRRATVALNAPEHGFSFLNITMPIEPPVDVSAAALEEYILNEVRKVIRDAADFTHVKKN